MRISDWGSDVCSSDLRDDLAFTPQIGIGETGNIAHVNARAHHLAALADRLQRCGNEGADRREYDRGIQLFGRQVGRPARPAAPQRPRELLPALVAFLREGIDFAPLPGDDLREDRSAEHTSELQSLMRISYAVFCLKKTNITTT